MPLVIRLVGLSTAYSRTMTHLNIVILGGTWSKRTTLARRVDNAAVLRFVTSPVFVLSNADESKKASVREVFVAFESGDNLNIKTPFELFYQGPKLISPFKVSAKFSKVISLI